LEDQRALPKIVPLLSDKDPVVRSYAASTVGTLGGSAYLKDIHRALVKEKDELARVGFYEALFLLGEPDVLPEMLKLLESSDYHVRCSVANSLEVMPLTTSDVHLAVTALLAASRKPCAVADQTTTTRVLKAFGNL
jgi:HEAT repeat protein